VIAPAVSFEPDLFSTDVLEAGRGQFWLTCDPDFTQLEALSEVSDTSTKALTRCAGDINGKFAGPSPVSDASRFPSHHSE